MVSREPRNHADDCYFCLTNITGFNASSRKKIKYPNLRSAMRPVPHSDDLSVPTPPINKDLFSSSDEEIPSREDSAESISLEDIESTYSGTSGNESDWITQEDLNDLARDLYLSKKQSELLASRLKLWNLVQEDVRITSFRNRNKDLASFFDMGNKLCYCTNIPGLFTSLGLPHNPSDWRLFIDSSKQSLKGVLLHNGNKYPSIPIAHSVHLKESYDNMELLLEAIKYREYQWSLCGDLKVIDLLMGMQAGFTKYCCFLCLWDSRAVSQHYKQKDWGSRSTFVPGEHSLKENPLVDINLQINKKHLSPFLPQTKNLFLYTSVIGKKSNITNIFIMKDSLNRRHCNVFWSDDRIGKERKKKKEKYSCWIKLSQNNPSCKSEKKKNRSLPLKAFPASVIPSSYLGLFEIAVIRLFISLFILSLSFSNSCICIEWQKSWN